MAGNRFTSIGVERYRPARHFWTVQFRYLWIVACIHIHRHPHLLRFAEFSLVGLTGLVVDLAIFSALLPSFGLSLARALAIWAAMTWNYALNRQLTFKHASESNSVPNQYVRFCLACLVGGLVNWSTTLGLCHVSSWLSANAPIAAVFGVMAGSLVNYIACSRWVFGDQHDFFE